MIRFSCPTCTSTIEAPDHRAGDKVSCPKCKQRLQIPTPPSRNKTVLGQPEDLPDLVPPPVRRPPTQQAAPDPEDYTVTNCPVCGLALKLPVRLMGSTVRCQNCKKPFVAGYQPQPQVQSQIMPTSPRLDYLPEEPPPFKHLPHSGLGISSFIIALLVGGINLMLLMFGIIGMSGASRGDGPEVVGRVAVAGLGTGMMLVCTNIMSVPLCLIGLGLSIVAMVSHRDRNHLFSWIGFLINGMVIVGVLALFAMLAALPHVR